MIRRNNKAPIIEYKKKISDAFNSVEVYPYKSINVNIIIVNISKFNIKKIYYLLIALITIILMNI